MNSQGLKEMYDQIYKDGSEKFFSFPSYPESKMILDMMDWRGKRVLEIGCGEGRLAAMIAMAGGNVKAIDYSKEAIAIAEKRYDMPNLWFKCCDLKEVDVMFDVVILQGVLEHLDQPFETLKYLLTTNVCYNGTLITSSPNFMNPRGYVWMTLNLLFGVPMTLSDLHFLSVPDFVEFCRENEFKLDISSCDHDWGAGDRLLSDFTKRLPDTLTRAGMDNSGVDRLLDWLKKTNGYFEHTLTSGVNVAYRINK